ncbi:nucleotidyltransferase family protein [Candidatus Woesearchaeota archaeon]|nr:nucleotidyltransferase family protein [Candidatus Woesearchaeota archaeon]
MPEQAYKSILLKLAEKKISYLLLRYPHIHHRPLTDLDLLVETDEDYRKAKNLLLRDGFIEIDKEGYRSFLAKKQDSELLVIDLYKEVSWLGWIVLTKEELFKRKQTPQPTIVVPSNEDELLIYAAQALFKNHGLNEYKTTLLHHLLDKKLDYKYILKQTSDNNWNAAYNLLITKLQDRTSAAIHFSTFEIVTSLLRSSVDTSRLIQLVNRTLRFLAKKVIPSKRTTTICFIGVDGSGKSTIIKNTQQHLPTFFEKFSLKIQNIYFGWKPFLPTTRIISGVMRKKEYKIVEKTNQTKQTDQNKSKTSFKQSIIFTYTFIDYLAKYFWNVGLRHTSRRILLIDRYFYDMFVHYQHVRESRWCQWLIQIYPRPDFIFLLKAPIEVIEARKQEMSHQQLVDHYQTYEKIATLVNIPVIETSGAKDKTVDVLLEAIWRDVAKKYAKD